MKLQQKNIEFNFDIRYGERDLQELAEQLIESDYFADSDIPKTKINKTAVMLMIKEIIEDRIQDILDYPEDHLDFDLYQAEKLFDREIELNKLNSTLKPLSCDK